MAHIAGLARGTAVAQIATLAAVPFLARIYGLDDFGVFGIFSTASTGFAVAAAGRFERGIVPAATDRVAVLLAWLSFAVIAAACALLGVALLIATQPLTDFVASPQMRAALYWLPLGIASQAAGQVLLQWATRCHSDTAMTRFYGERALIMTTAQIALGLIGTSQNGLILGQIAGFAGAALLLWRRVPKLSSHVELRDALAEVGKVARANSDFPRYGLPRTLTEAAAVVALPMLISACYGPAAMGGFWMALRILGLPGSVLAEPIHQIFFRKASDRKRSGMPVLPLTIQAMLAVSVITVPYAAVILIGGKTLFLWVLGPNWTLAAGFAQVMLPGWMALFAGGLLPLVVILLDRQKQHFLCEIGLRLCEIFSILMGYVVGSILVSLALWSAVNVLYVAVLLLLLKRTEMRSDAVQHGWVPTKAGA